MRIPEHERRILEDRLVEYELPHLAPAILELAQPCVRLRTRPAAVRVGGSKIGGDPDLPVDALWPSFEGQPLVFLAQLDLADVSARFASPLPSTGLLSFFFDRSTLEQDVGQVLYTREPVQRRRAEGERFEECDVELVITTSVPAIGFRDWAYSEPLGVPALTDDELDRLLEWRSNLDYWFGLEEARHQLLGYPYGRNADVLLQRAWGSGPWPADVAPARAWRNLLELHSDERAHLDWADGGTCWFLVENAALEAGDFSRTDTLVHLG